MDLKKQKTTPYNAYHQFLVLLSSPVHKEWTGYKFSDRVETFSLENYYMLFIIFRSHLCCFEPSAQVWKIGCNQVPTLCGWIHQGLRMQHSTFNLFSPNTGAQILTTHVLKFERCILMPVDVSKYCWISRKQCRPWSVARSVASNLGLHCLLRPVYPRF